MYWETIKYISFVTSVWIVNAQKLQKCLLFIWSIFAFSMVNLCQLFVIKELESQYCNFNFWQNWRQFLAKLKTIFGKIEDFGIKIKLVRLAITPHPNQNSHMAYLYPHNGHLKEQYLAIPHLIITSWSEQQYLTFKTPCVLVTGFAKV